MSLCVIQSCIVFTLPGCWRKQFQQSELCWFPSSANLAIISGIPFFSQANLWSPIWARNMPVCIIVDVGDRSEKVDTNSSRAEIQLFLEACIPFSIYIIYINRVKNVSIPQSKKEWAAAATNSVPPCSTCPRASSPSDDTGGTRRRADLFRIYATACHSMPQHATACHSMPRHATQVQGSKV